jgi:hypothetical protein
MKKKFELPEVEIIEFEIQESIAKNDSWDPEGDDLGWQE